METAWVVTKGLDHTRSQVNARFPKRDKASDGTIGDLAHQLESASGHNPDITGKAEYKDGDKLNEVRAWDMDSDLNDAYGYTAEKLVQYLVTLGRSGVYLPFRYFIYRSRIWRKANGWKTEQYNGPSPHDEHVHFSGDYSEKADNWAGDLGIATLGIPKELDMDLTAKNLTDIANAVWAVKGDVDVTAKGTNLQARGSILDYTSDEHRRAIAAATAAQAAANAAAAKCAEMESQISGLTTQNSQILEMLRTLTGAQAK